MILLEPANKITHANVGDQAADHLSNAVSGTDLQRLPITTFAPF